MQQGAVVVQRTGCDERVHDRHDDAFALELPTEQAGLLEQGIGQGQLAQGREIRIQDSVCIFGRRSTQQFQSYEPGRGDEVLPQEGLEDERVRMGISRPQEVDPD